MEEEGEVVIYLALVVGEVLQMAEVVVELAAPRGQRRKEEEVPQSPEGVEEELGVLLLKKACVSLVEEVVSCLSVTAAALLSVMI